VVVLGSASLDVWAANTMRAVPISTSGEAGLNGNIDVVQVPEWARSRWTSRTQAAPL
jgi:hypothetical protein